jgi:hypothetical protein
MVVGAKLPGADHLETILTSLNTPESEYGKQRPVNDPLHLIRNVRTLLLQYDVPIPSHRNAEMRKFVRRWIPHDFSEANRRERVLKANLLLEEL